MRSKLPFWGLHPAERHAPLPRALGMWGALSFTAAQRGTGNTDPCETAVLCICRTVITKDQFCPKKTIKKVRSQNGGSGPLRLIRRRPCFQGQAGGRRGGGGNASFQTRCSAFPCAEGALTPRRTRAQRCARSSEHSSDRQSAARPLTSALRDQDREGARCRMAPAALPPAPWGGGCPLPLTAKRNPSVCLKCQQE